MPADPPGNPMKSKLIMNPVAGTDAAPDYLQMINDRLLQAVESLDIAITGGPGDATNLAKQAVAEGCEQLFVAGGDGTLNEVLNGVGHVSGGLQTVTFGVVPLGTGNDFATALGIPPDIEGAIDALLRSEPTAVDVGCMNDVYFVNVSAGGFIAEVSDAVTPRLKTFAGKIAYLVGGAQVLLQLRADARAHRCSCRWRCRPRLGTRLSVTYLRGVQFAVGRRRTPHRS